MVHIFDVVVIFISVCHTLYSSLLFNQFNSFQECLSLSPILNKLILLLPHMFQEIILDIIRSHRSTCIHTYAKYAILIELLSPFIFVILRERYLHQETAIRCWCELEIHRAETLCSRNDIAPYSRQTCLYIFRFENDHSLLLEMPGAILLIRVLHQLTDVNLKVIGQLASQDDFDLPSSLLCLYHAMDGILVYNLNSGTRLDHLT